MKTTIPIDSDGNTKQESVEVVLQTNYKDPIKRYQLAERVVWSRTPNWKRSVIVQCKLTAPPYKGVNVPLKEMGGAGETESILNEYSKAITRLAESDNDKEIAAGDKLPPVPSYTLESEMTSKTPTPSV